MLNIQLINKKLTEESLRRPKFQVGDVIDLVYEDVLSRSRIRKFTGICLARTKAGFGFRYTLRNVFNNVAVEIAIDGNSTVVVSLTRSPLYKKVAKRKAKLFYLRKKRLVDSKV